MKRDARLKALSEAHHRALLLARKLLLASRGYENDVRRAWEDLQRRFERELEPHFRIEEGVFSDALLSIGAAGYVEQLKADHSRIRALLTGPTSDLSTTLIHVAGELIQHVRWEESDLYDFAQANLPLEKLELVSRACEIGLPETAPTA